MPDKVWLVAWESWKWSGEKRRVPERHLASLLRGDLSADIVREIVEAIHANRCHSIEERLMQAKGNRKNPHKAEIETSTDGEEMIMCGHDPYLSAIRIENPKIEKVGNESYLVW